MAAMAKYPEPLIFGLDIGTRSIVGTVGYKEREKFNVVAMSVKYHDSRSMIDGQIHDIARVSEDIKSVKEELEQKIGGRKLSDVCIAAAGRVLKTAVGHSEYEFDENTVITQEYIHSIDLIGVEKAHDIILEELKESSDSTKYYCVGYSTVKYYLNDYEILNLEGHKGVKIAADVLATFLPEEVVNSLYTAVEMAGLNVANLTLEPIAAMNVAIPESYRLLNIALVDVGAGTSDICITKDGSVIGYGMIPSAGDEMSEIIMKKYLVDFNTAEKLKVVSTKRKSVSYKDVMGITHKITPAEIQETIETIKQEITDKIADKIRELNGGASVSAVFVVGGGGKLEGFTDMLAGALGLPEERVAIRGKEVMNDINFLIDDFDKDSLYVTPIGICLSFFDHKNNFIFVSVNDERVKLYNNDKLTIYDAAVQYGIPTEKIFPRRGPDISFKINGKPRIVRGYSGEAAVIKQNGKVVGMNSAIEANDKIQITESTVGRGASMELSSLPEYSGTLDFVVNGNVITCPKFAVVNNVPQSSSYMIQDGDDIEMRHYYTLEQLLLFMDVNPPGEVMINNKPASHEQKIYKNFVVEWKEDIEYSDLPEPESNTNFDGSGEDNGEKEEEKEEKDGKEPFDIHITVNKKPITMTGKSKYVFVDIFDYIQFDLSTVHGNKLITNVNNEHAEYVRELHEGDVVDVYWEK